jgi:hypothetical protein
MARLARVQRDEDRVNGQLPALWTTASANREALDDPNDRQKPRNINWVIGHKAPIAGGGFARLGGTRQPSQRIVLKPLHRTGEPRESVLEVFQLSNTKRLGTELRPDTSAWGERRPRCALPGADHFGQRGEATLALFMVFRRPSASARIWR